MIYVVEFPHAGHATCWFAFDEDDFVAKVHADARHAQVCIHACISARRMAELIAARSGGAQAPEWVLALADTHGWDTPLYRADYAYAPGEYRAEPISVFEACVAAADHGLAACRLYLNETQALAALHGDPAYQGRDGFHAHMALREQLIALEALADDM